ncbi:MAG: hypothetical protein ABI847_15020 [Anaerolineales bacterium]
MTAGAAQGPRRPTGWRLDLAWLAPAILAHALGLAAYINWADFAANPPFHYTDYATHFAATDAVSHFLAGGRLWGYSPYFLAGFPEGTLVDLDNKGVELASFGLARLGLSLPHAFNGVMLALMAGAPFAIYAAARLLKLPAPAAGVAQWLMLAAWYADGAVRWMWQGSILTFAAAALGSLVVAAAFWRWAAGGAPGGRLSLIVWFGMGPLLFWLHAEAFVILAVTLGLGTLAFGRRWDLRAWLVVVGWVVWVILANWAWLGPDLRQLGTLAPTHDLQGGLSQLRYDATTAYALLRVALFGMAALGLWTWRKTGVAWWPAAGLGVGLWLVVAYGGGYLGLGALEPYRLILPALGLATLPAADWLVRQWGERRWPAALAATVFIAAAALPLYRARPQGLRQVDGTPSDSLSGPQPAERAVCATLAKLDLGAGRVLTNDWRLGAWLPACSGAQVIGGPSYLVWTQFNQANADQERVFGQLVAGLSPADLAAVLSQYNVHWVVVNTAFHNWVNLADWDRQHPGTFELVAQNGPFQIMAVVGSSTWFMSGSGTLTADYNRITIRRAAPGGVVIKYHWLPSLRTEPALPMRPVYAAGDPVPFIAVDNGSTADFDIVQS